ncbi:hypothetical protein AcV7_002007 [Taiwanofungus camphoratus]|nr:hypothetical protein AcV7_002007 [Antrodia cinnamomea]
MITMCHRVKSVLHWNRPRHSPEARRASDAGQKGHLSLVDYTKPVSPVGCRRELFFTFHKILVAHSPLVS